MGKLNKNFLPLSNHLSFLLLFLVLMCPLGLFPVAQAQYDTGLQEGEYSLVKQTKSDLTIIVSAGLGGAVLGLSTLSFVERPSDHWDNVLTGGALGIIAGVIYVAYRQTYGPTGVLGQQVAPPESLIAPLMERDRLGVFWLARF